MPLTNLLGADLGFTGGHITDVNSEGSPPATQFFIDKVTLVKGQHDFPKRKCIQGRLPVVELLPEREPNRRRWCRRLRLSRHSEESVGNHHRYPWIRRLRIVGAILRYYLFRPLESANTNEQIEALYQQQKTNPATLEIVGTIAPLYEEEHILTTPTGRLMICNQAADPNAGRIAE